MHPQVPDSWDATAVMSDPHRAAFAFRPKVFTVVRQLEVLTAFNTLPCTRYISSQGPRLGEVGGTVRPTIVAKISTGATPLGRLAWLVNRGSVSIVDPGWDGHIWKGKRGRRLMFPPKRKFSPKAAKNFLGAGMRSEH